LTRVYRRGAMWMALAICMAGAPAEAATPLRTIVEGVPGSTAYRYGTRDSMGNSMDTLKVVSHPYGGYRGVYHTFVNGRPVVKFATSLDLINWRYQADLAQNASHATIYNLPGSAALVAFERQTGCTGGGNCITLRYYESESALQRGAASRWLTLPRTLSSCAEGTPSITSATSTLSSIQISFHYFKDCKTDRQGRGTLRAFDPLTWTSSTAPSLDAGIIAAGASPGGHVGDRDAGFYDGASQRLFEGQLVPDDFSSWRNFLWVGSGATQLAIRTHGGSTAFANPTFTALTLPTGQAGVVVTQFVPVSGAAPGEAGELVYYRPRDPGPPPSPTIAAAGDISCTQNATCHDDETSNLLAAALPTRVLTLGDNQYENGELANFQTFYEPDWGRMKHITAPSPGNHDPPSSGYGPYFRKPANYSFDLGAWHLISLDSTNVPAATTFLTSDLAGRTNRCILAYWHHPRFSSGATHGNNALTAPFWDRLYAAGADVVLAGHDHIYERFAPQTPAAVASPTGIREFIVGTGGRALHQLGTVRANSETRLAGTFGVLRMTLHPTAYDWRFQGEDGVTYDSGSDVCS
jgi:hypothetical protein